MISARLRYTGTSLLALAALVTGLTQLLDRAWPGAVLGLALTIDLLLGCRRIRRTAEHHQEEQRRELEALRTETRAVPAERCGDWPSEVFTWLHPGQYAECVLRPGHPGSHADEHGMRWWWIDTGIPPHTRAPQL
ncbi:hypothetical protein [Streptomyces sp. NPDC045714]|uniref:hypothetical protein n=1 Tax=Streptomyces sp. NPDC045714 TaxID=3154913 RepID=UPI0033FAFCAD